MTVPFSCWALPGRRDRFNFVLIDLADEGWLRRYDYKCNLKGYAYREVPRPRGGTYYRYLHQDIMRVPPGANIEVHHIDHCPQNDRRENLDIQTKAQHRRTHAGRLNVL